MKIKKAVIPVAGLGTRMLPAFAIIPKELLPIYDKPLISMLLRRQLNQNRKIIFITRSGRKQ